jgi:hypothetical protein
MHTAENRRLLIDTAKYEANYAGTDSYGCKWYFSTMDNGHQVWVSIQNSIIQNGGINSTPITDFSFLEVIR